MRRYLVLLAVMLAAGALLVAVGRTRRDAARGLPAAARTPLARIALAVGDSGVVPARSSVPGGALVSLSLENRSAHPVVVALSGYQDRLRIGTLPPAGRWAGSFFADRPGDDFAWIVDGEPRGRLAVTGSHLIEGHR
jgi:hypothetical protein